MLAYSVAKINTIQCLPFATLWGPEEKQEKEKKVSILYGDSQDGGPPYRSKVFCVKRKWEDYSGKGKNKIYLLSLKQYVVM